MICLHRLPALLLLLTLPACTPKDDGDDTGDEAGTTTTGDEVTTGDASDPTAPATMSASGTSGPSTATTADTVTSTTTTTAGTATTEATTSTTTANPTDPTGMTSSTTEPVDTEDPVDPPVPCEGEAKPLVGITTTIGYLKSQIPPRPDPTGGSSTTGGDELDPGTLFVKLSDQAFMCADPNAPLACGPHWEVTIVIPPEFQSPGVHNLLGQNVRGSSAESGPDEGVGECSFGGGSFGATFEIIAIDDQIIEGRLCNVEGFFFDTDPQLEGSFTATLCPQ